MSAGAGSAAYAETRPVRKLGRALRRRRRLRVGITQLFYVLAGVALGLLLPLIPVGFTVPQAEAAQMLFAVGAGLLTFIGVVFSLLFLVVQFGSTTFTPRLNLFHSAPIVWHAFAFYTGVLVYRLRRRPQHERRRSHDGIWSPSSPSCSCSSRSPSSAACRCGPSARSSSPPRSPRSRSAGARSSTGCIRTSRCPRPAIPEVHGPCPTGRRDVIWTAGPGIVQAIDVPRILGAARDADAVVEIVVPFGETVQQHAPVAVVHGICRPVAGRGGTQGDPDRCGAHLRAGPRPRAPSARRHRAAGACRRPSTTRPRRSRSSTARRVCCGCSSGATSTSAR